MIIFAILLVVLIVASIGTFIWKSNQGGSHPLVIKPPTKSYYAGNPRRVFETDRFRFESSNKWQLSQEESLGTSKYVYFTHSLNNNLIEYELDILFDKSLDGKDVNYVMPVSLNNGKMTADILSGRCGDTIVTQRGNSAPSTLQLNFHGTSFLCQVKGSTESAAAGLVGGGYDIPLKDSKGHLVILNLGFVNDSSSYFGSAFKEVIDSFKLK